MRYRGWFLWIGSALVIGGAAVLAWHSWTLHEQDASQRRAKEWLTRTREVHRNSAQRAEHVAPHRVIPALPLRRGDVVGELAIPRLRLSVMVFEGDDAGILREGAGHIPGTALPFGRGNIGIAA